LHSQWDTPWSRADAARQPQLVRLPAWLAARRQARRRAARRNRKMRAGLHVLTGMGGGLIPEAGVLPDVI